MFCTAMSVCFQKEKKKNNTYPKIQHNFTVIYNATSPRFTKQHVKFAGKVQQVIYLSVYLYTFVSTLYINCI